MATGEIISRAQEAAKSRLTFLLLLGLGFTLIVVASLEAEGLRSRVITSIGGVLFGAGLSLLINGVFSPAPFDRLLTVLSQLVDAPWRRTDETELAVYRRQFHGYLHTKHAGKWVWLYRVFDFGISDAPGLLHATIKYDVNQREAKYEYYGLTIKKRLILIGRNANSPHEPSVIQVFPDHAQTGLHAGMAFTETPHDGNIVTSSIMAETSLIPEITKPCLLDDAHNDLLLSKWRAAFKNTMPPNLGKDDPVQPTKDGKAI